jgi:hypothetical protein
MAPSHNYFARLWLVSACFVVAISFLPPSDLNYDLTIQLQASQHLLSGNGLSIYSLAGEPDLAAPNRLVLTCALILAALIGVARLPLPGRAGDGARARLLAAPGLKGRELS